jgi:hypothetical protein
MKALLFSLFISSAFFSFSQQVKSHNIEKTETKAQIVTKQEPKSVKYTAGTKKEVQSLEVHPFFEKRNEYIKHLIEVDKNIIPVYRSTETSTKNVNRLINWAYTNKNLFAPSYLQVIDNDYSTL